MGIAWVDAAGGGVTLTNSGLRTLNRAHGDNDKAELRAGAGESGAVVMSAPLQVRFDGDAAGELAPKRESSPMDVEHHAMACIDDADAASFIEAECAKAAPFIGGAGDIDDGRAHSLGAARERTGANRELIISSGESRELARGRHSC